MKRLAIRLGTLISLALCMLPAAPAGAVIAGDLDGSAHPNVGLLYFSQPDGRFRCSGTLISPTVVLTAAHCTLGSTDVFVTFDTVATRDPLVTGDASRYITGTAHANPLYTDGKLQLNTLNDSGVIVLDQPASSKWPGITPAQLPPAGYLDGTEREGRPQEDAVPARRLRRLLPEARQRAEEARGRQRPTRRNTTAGIQNLSTETIKLQENAKNSQFGGGTCFGDSGGAIFLNGLLVGDTSFGGSQFCSGGMGGYQRSDSPNARAFLSHYVTLP